MSDTLKILLTASATLIGGVILFILGEFVRTLVIIPLQKYKEHVEIVLDRLDYYANYYTRVHGKGLGDEQLAEMTSYKSHMRSAASQLQAKYALISSKWLLVKLKIVPPAVNINQAHGALIYLSNSILFEDEVDPHQSASNNSNKADEVRSALTLP